MKVTVNYPTGNWFEDGTIEIGKVQEAEIFTRKDLDNLLDDIPEGEDYFLADTDGNRVEAYDIMKGLDEEDEEMKNYNDMGYAEFMAEMDEYIATLKQGEALTEKEWKTWIAQEAKDHDEELTDEQIGWIVEKLEEDGYVKPTLWYAVQTDREDDWGTGSYDYNEAVKMLKRQGRGLIAVIDGDVCVNEIEYEAEYDSDEEV